MPMWRAFCGRKALSARIAASRHRQAEAGAQLLQVRLMPEAHEVLLRITADTGETKSAAISRLLVEAGTIK